MTNKEYWLYLSKVKGLSSARRRMLLEILGSPEEIYRAKEETLRKIPLLEDYQINQLVDYRKVDFEAEAIRIKRAGIRFVTSEEENFPEKLKNIPDAPDYLFYRGELPDNNHPAVAVVGSRKCSMYGREMCLKFSESMARAGINIISGMASGVDGFAHRGAIKSGGKTTAVLGCGVDVCYPSMNRDIFDVLSDNGSQSYYTAISNLEEKLKDGQCPRSFGGIISEYYPGEKALPYNFPLRNRIISGLADVLLVVEAGKKSGTFITVDHALEQGKEIFAIPGRIGDTVSDGCNSLIKNGAGLATEPEDIIDVLQSHYSILLAAEKRKNKDKKDEALNLVGDERKVYECLEVVPVQINEVSARTGIDCGKLSGILVGLELKGMIEEVGKNLYIKK